ncbi:MAG: LysR family transcriptional regulator [Gammaproteobacteria bacterium]|nr:LysR family transcriptional regulator [Gammaproteobacteria bacterium]
MLEDIEIFCAIAKEGGFAKAARALQLSTSIVTRRLARLEKNLDVRLVHRTTRQVSLTEEGRLYFDEVSNILDALKASNKNVKSLSTEVAGTLKIGLPVSISHLYVTPHLHEFLAQYPNLKVHIINGNHLFDLLGNGFDLILHCGELPNSNYYYKKLGLWEKITCASPEYLKKYGIPKKPEDLSNHNCLDHAESFHGTWRFQELDKSKNIPVSGNVRVNSSLDLCNLAKSGLGMVYLPSFSVAEALKSGELVSVLDSYRPEALGLYLVYPSHKYLSYKTQVFIDFMANLLT